jgi:hypothetical protein
MGRIVFTMPKRCPACHCTFTITGAARMYCQNRDCKNKRRRDDYAARKQAAPAVPDGSAAHLERALRSGD